MPTPALSNQEITTALADLDGWERHSDSLVKTFSLPSYAAGLMFATLVGAIAEGHDHHPDMTVGYKKVTVSFSTHDAGDKISQKDVDMARAINALPYPPKKAD